MTDLEQFRADGHAAIDWAADYLEGVRDLPVMSTVAPGEIRAHLPAAPPEQAESFADVLADVDRVLMPGVTHWNHPRFFAYFSITGSQPGILAELLTATLNLNGMLWRTSPAVTELEQLTLSWMCQLLGLPEAWHGHIEDSASTSTLAALCAARTVRPRSPRRRRVRARPLVHRPRLPDPRPGSCATSPSTTTFVCVSDALDLATPAPSWPPSARPRRPRSTPSRRSPLRRPPPAPGCTSTPRTDGSARVCPELRTPGFEHADSVVVNPHKWLFTPVDCSCLFTSRPDDLRAAFALTPEYLRTSAEGVLNLNEYGPSLGRRFRALKLWAVLRCYGREGLQVTIREHVRLAELFEGWVRDEPGWELCAPRPYSVVCFRPEGDDARSEALLEAVNAERRGLPLAHAPERQARPALRGRQCRDDRGRCPRGLACAQARGRASRRRRVCKRLMRVLVLQHIACEPPGVFEDVLLERGHELVRVELDEGEPLPEGAGARSSPWAGR